MSFDAEVNQRVWSQEWQAVATTRESSAAPNENGRLSAAPKENGALGGR